MIELIRDLDFVRYLDLQLNDFGEKGIEMLSEYLKNSKIEFLNLTKIFIETNNIFFQNLSLSKSMRTLILNKSGLTNESLRLFNDSIKSGCSITELDLSSNFITGSGMEDLISLLHKVRMKKLVLSFNKLNDDGIKKLSEGIDENNFLEHL